MQTTDPSAQPSRPSVASATGKTTSGLLIALTLRGVVLPESGDRPELPLELADLQVLRQIAATGATAWASDRPKLVAELEARGLAPRGAAPTDRPLSPNPGPADATARLDDFYIVTTPAVLCVGPGGFEQVSEDGRLLARLDAVELLAASEFCKATTAREALQRHAARAGAERLDERSFLRVLSRLMASGLLLRFDLTDTAQGRALSREDRDIRRAIAKQMELTEVVRRDMEAYDAQERARAARTGVTRPRVVPIHSQWKITPLALGMIIAYAKQYEGGRLDERYDFRPDWLTDPARASSPKAPSLFLFSHYIWSSVGNLELSAQLKASDPRAITVHGGPNVPKYEKDLEAYFRMHPHVDIAVRGEGEVTAAEMFAALAEVIDDPRPDLAVLEKVPGLAFRLGDRIVRTPDRERITDLDVIPSPYLTGLFDSFGKAATEAAVIESNRGCPYGCTFCDWGSATAQRIRKFSLERVFEEIEWCGRHGVETIGLADANFGVFERDVAIAEKVAEVKARYGYPRHFGVNYAKNSLKHLKPIVKILSGAGTIAYGQLSLQSMDPGTLETIERHNIKSEKYHELAQEFRQAGLPLFIDLMMGLPGSTVTSFRADLQQAIDREVIAKVYPTQLLVNSPMNDPEYRQTHDIQAKPGSFLTSCASFSQDDYARMKEMRRVFLLLEKFGILRHVARHVRRETGLREMDFFERLLDDGRAARTRWPVLAFTLESVPNLMVPPGRWQMMLDEVRQYLTAVLGIADDSALQTVLTVQRLLLPARNRRFPDEVQLPHDYAAWYGAMLAAKDAGHLQDWTSVVPPLREYGPGMLRVNDPFDVCVFGIGHSVESDSFGVWELDSPISRPVVPLHSALS